MGGLYLNIEHQGKEHPCVAFCNEEGGYWFSVAFGSEKAAYHHRLDRYIDEFQAHCGLDINGSATILLRKEKNRRHSSGEVDSSGRVSKCGDAMLRTYLGGGGGGGGGRGRERKEIRSSERAADPCSEMVSAEGLGDEAR